MTFLETYKQADRSKYEKDAFQVLVTDLMVDNKFGQKKFRELTAQNMEQSMVSNFVPTMFYIFMYVKNKPEIFNDIEFYDRCPLILCTSVDNTSVTGINFNLIPNNIRAVFIDVLYKNYKDFYDNVFNTSFDNMVLNQQLGSILTVNKGISALMSAMKIQTGVDLSSCIRKYNRTNILKVRMIEYDQWHYIPFLSFKDSVRGAGLAELQAELVTKNR